MTRGGQHGVQFVPGVPQTRACECDRPAVFDEGRCVKCGHRHEPALHASTRALGDAIALILNR